MVERSAVCTHSRKRHLHTSKAKILSSQAEIDPVGDLHAKLPATVLAPQSLKPDTLNLLLTTPDLQNVPCNNPYLDPKCTQKNSFRVQRTCLETLVDHNCLMVQVDIHYHQQDVQVPANNPGPSVALSPEEVTAGLLISSKRGLAKRISGGRGPSSWARTWMRWT